MTTETTGPAGEAKDFASVEMDAESIGSVAPSATGSSVESPAPALAADVSAARFVYAIGRIEPRFPGLAVEKEFAQVSGRAETVGLSDPEVLQQTLHDSANRYLARQLAWVLSVEGVETYLLVPRDPVDLQMLVEAVRPQPKRDDVDVVIGVQAGLSSPEEAGGLVLPILHFDQIYSFDIDSLRKAIPRPGTVKAADFEGVVDEVLTRVSQMADNAGATDEHRALNYLVVRYPAIYAGAAEAHARGASLSAVEVRPSRLSSLRRVVDVIFDYRDRQTDVVDSSFVRVDVTEEFPFLVTKLSPYFRR